MVCVNIATIRCTTTLQALVTVTNIIMDKLKGLSWFCEGHRRIVRTSRSLQPRSNEVIIIPDCKAVFMSRFASATDRNT